MESEQCKIFGCDEDDTSGSDTVSEGETRSEPSEPELHFESLKRHCLDFVSLEGKDNDLKECNEERQARNAENEGENEADEDEMSDNLLYPPSMFFRKFSNPEVSNSASLVQKFKRQLSEDGRERRRGSLGGALTGKYLLPYVSAQQAWSATGSETTNLVRMRSQTLGKSAPSLTASLILMPLKDSDGLERSSTSQVTQSAFTTGPLLSPLKPVSTLPLFL
ncbi:Microtubule-associated serine/threonine-protein kinase 4 [Triplophysa tibetana]|uniref:Microtubule-associated serine/threonine-protein kinase 4 n=1 Tax=Triplophysa tibetana TaxID=1572043 RepID=A0A5A9P4G4_9TELE|nr:Microtubule-associated serine/threonine-protein kinase 4 [Triplophysa tibetana]